MIPQVSPEIPVGRFEIYASGLDHPECLVFDREGNLWAGGEGGQVYGIGSDRTVKVVAELAGFCAGVTRTPDDTELFVCNSVHGIVRVKGKGEWSLFANAASGHKLVCPNFGLFDRRGNYYMTDSGNWQRRNGYVLKFGSDGQGAIVAGPFGYANGLALSEDERRLFMVESDTDRVFQIDIFNNSSSVYAEQVGRMPDGLALDASGNLYASCYASDEIYRISGARQKTLFAWDRWAILLSRPTNIAFRDGYLYAANLGRTTITRAHVGIQGKPLAHEYDQARR